MKKTGRVVYLYCKDMGWNFKRVIWSDGNSEYIKINGGYVDLEWAIMRADMFHLDFVG